MWSPIPGDVTHPRGARSATHGTPQLPKPVSRRFLPDTSSELLSCRVLMSFLELAGDTSEPFIFAPLPGPDRFLPPPPPARLSPVTLGTSSVQTLWGSLADPPCSGHTPGLISFESKASASPRSRPKSLSPNPDLLFLSGTSAVIPTRQGTPSAEPEVGWRRGAWGRFRGGASGPRREPLNFCLSKLPHLFLPSSFALYLSLVWEPKAES